MASSTHLDQNLFRFRSTHLEQILKVALRLKHDNSSLSQILDHAEDWLCRLRAMAEEVILPGFPVVFFVGSRAGECSIPVPKSMDFLMVEVGLARG